MNSFENRRYVIVLTFIVIALIFITRLLYIQVIDDKWAIKAQLVSENKLRVRPSRGHIYDRNGQLLVANIPVYDLMVTPRKVKNIDTMAFCEMVGITKESFINRMEKAKNYATYKASAFIRQISAEEFTPINEQLYRYEGFFGASSTLRGYPLTVGAHVLGYIGEASRSKIEEDPYYKLGDYMGVTGIERNYEEHLRGKPGVRYVLMDALNKVKGSIEEGKYDTLAQSGHNLYTTLDAELQAYGELLMQNKKGSIVAIEPNTGEILSLVSSPAYDPNLLVGRARGKNYQALVQNDSLKPMFNRALQAPYPPGSIFKLIMAAVALEEGVISETATFPCNKALVGCHNHPTCTSVQMGIQHSCNPYFYGVTKKIINQGDSRSIFKDTEIGMARWQKHVMSFGLGQRLEIDLPNLKGGLVPGADYYNNIYGQGRYAFSTIYSISIGQGEVQMVPLQMANLAAIMANGGWYYTPHLVRKIGEDGDKLEKYQIKNYTSVSAQHFPAIREGMRRVVNEPGGTARRARLDSIIVCGKTGTAQNPHGEDHSVFIAFAPMDNPQIAIAVFVENSGFGGTWAAPIASLMIEKHLTDSIADPKKEQRILEADLIELERVRQQ